MFDFEWDWNYLRKDYDCLIINGSFVLWSMLILVYEQHAESAVLTESGTFLDCLFFKTS